MPPELYIIIAGNIGTGKTSLALELQNLLDGSRVFTEQKGRFVEKFYSDSGYAFLNQLDYSLQYLEHSLQIIACEGTVIQDRSIFDTHQVFSKMQMDAGNISHEEYLLLSRLFSIAISVLEPNMLVFLDTTVGMSYERMTTRGDREESSVTKEYLRILREKYNEWYDKFNICPKCKIETSSLRPGDIAKRVVQLLRNL